MYRKMTLSIYETAMQISSSKQPMTVLSRATLFRISSVLLAGVPEYGLLSQIALLQFLSQTHGEHGGCATVIL